MLRLAVFVLCSLFGYSLCAHSCEPNSALCMEAKGQFAVPNECRKFANCWDSCATLSSCPGTLVFSDALGKCDFSWNLAADHPCFKPMGNIGGGIIGDIPKISPIPPLNPLFPTFSPLGNMRQQMNSDGSMSQSFSSLFGFDHQQQA
ncbi:uncharacterized protein LOC129583824 [Paramacrobiotus metropolitanus]|uniref:uncharacterized protein LOC129583824 n=1 Tax=Paramacrobiotus metropolitanus TaxID=2943436 RepID=UPI002445E536|nr:uncharacterized protein LOC129583824 [Paramacrobiotus metropolitanus]